jgi:signal transduction histidine kinase
LSHDIVTGHNGTLEFTTEVGAGSEFVVMLPKIAAPADTE